MRAASARRFSALCRERQRAKRVERTNRDQGNRDCCSVRESVLLIRFGKVGGFGLHCSSPNSLGKNMINLHVYGGPVRRHEMTVCVYCVALVWSKKYYRRPEKFSEFQNSRGLVCAPRRFAGASRRFKGFMSAGFLSFERNWGLISVHRATRPGFEFQSLQLR